MEVPSIREELSRKSLETLERLVLDRMKGAITEAQFSTGVNVLWDVVSGLTDKEFVGIVSTIVVNKNDDSFKRRTMMVCREHWIFTSVDTTALSVLVYRNGGSPPAEIVCESVEEALAKAEKIHQKAGLSGYAIIK